MQSKREIHYQKKEAGAGQPEVSPAVAVDVEIISREMLIRIQDLQCTL